VNERGEKRFLAIEDGVRESTQSWREVLLKLKPTNVCERFQERDLRAKVASDSDSLVEASERFGHADTAITQRGIGASQSGFSH